MNFDYSPKVKQLESRLRNFMDAQVYPSEARYHAEIASGDRWQPLELIEELKAKARSAGLWNLFLPESSRGAGLSATATKRRRRNGSSRCSKARSAPASR